MTIYKSDAPVSLEVHFAVLKEVERAVIKELGSVEHPWLPIGTRVAYYDADGCGAPVGEEHRLDCGMLDALDEAPTIEVTDDEWQAMLQKDQDANPLTIEFVDQLYEMAKRELEASAGRTLVVTVGGVLTGSTSCYGSGCHCWPRKGYYRNCSLCCTSTRC